MSEGPEYADGADGFLTTVLQEKTKPQLQSDDHNQAHRNWHESKRSAFERSLTLANGDNFTDLSPQTYLDGVPKKFLCNDNLDSLYRGPSDQLPLWDPLNSQVRGLVENGYYLMSIDYNGTANVGNGEFGAQLIDTFDGITSIAFTPPNEMGQAGVKLFYQSVFVFLAPAVNVTGRTYDIEFTARGTDLDMGIRQITIHRER